MKKIQLTDTHKEKLFQIPLFRNLPLNIKESLLEKLDFVVYIANKKEIVVTQGTPCNKLYVLLEGKLRTDIIDGLGNEVMIEYIIAPRTFATPHLFSSDNTLPATFTALEDSVILMAQRILPLKLSARTRKYCTIFSALQAMQYLYRITSETTLPQDCSGKIYRLSVRAQEERFPDSGDYTYAIPTCRIPECITSRLIERN
jgi:CRP-like cAMP-binding protein